MQKRQQYILRKKGMHEHTEVYPAFLHSSLFDKMPTVRIITVFSSLKYRAFL